jgi:hypothetical protein
MPRRKQIVKAAVRWDPEAAELYCYETKQSVEHVDEDVVYDIPTLERCNACIWPEREVLVQDCDDLYYKVLDENEELAAERRIEAALNCSNQQEYFEFYE